MGQPTFVPVQPSGVLSPPYFRQPELIDPKIIELEKQEQVPAKQVKPPSLGKYCYWQKKGYGWSCEYKRRNGKETVYKYLGYIHSYDLAALRGRMNESEIADYLRGIILESAESQQDGECDTPIIVR